jgi:hypothetical protein
MKTLMMLVTAVSLSCTAMDVLVPDQQGCATTGKFTVADREGDVLGVLLRADQKFFDNAAHVEFAMDDKTLRVEFVCPITPETELQYVKECAWNGDCVELFLRPDLTSSRHFQYCANVAGAFRAFKYAAVGAADAEWRSRAKAEVQMLATSYTIVLTIPRDEVFPKMLTDGDSFGINFVRSGPTAGGRSTWIKSCAGSTDIEALGTVIWGGGEGYFLKRTDAVRTNLPEKFTDSVKRSQAEKELEAFLVTAPRRVTDAKSLEAVEKAFENLETRFIDIALEGLALVAYEPKDIADDALAPDSSTKPLKSIRIVAPKGTRQVASFAVANRLDKWFLGQVKLFDGTEVSKRFSRAATNVIARQVSVSRCFPTYTRTGRADWDVVEPLPMGTVLRLAPHEHTPIFLEFDTRGDVAAGIYPCMLAVKKAVEGYETLKIPVEIEIVDIDLSETPRDKACYTYLMSFGNLEKNTAFLVNQDYNVISPNAMPYPALKADGTFAPQDFTKFDQNIDLYLKAGADVSKLKLWVFLGFEFNWLNPKDEKGSYLTRLSDPWKKSVRNRLTALVAHVQEKYGIGKDRIIWYIVDEPDGDIDDPTLKSKISLCYQAAKFLKEMDPAIRTMTDPHPLFLSSKGGIEPIARLRDYIDIIQLHRPSITPTIRDNVRSAQFPETWTYMIVGKGTPATTYRRALWENMRDGYREVSPFWHLDESAGWDMFDPSDSDRPGRYTDYASVYADHDLGTQLLSRRQLFYNQGCEEARLILHARRVAQGDPAKLARIEALVKTAADKGTMAAMESARVKIMEEIVK